MNTLITGGSGLLGCYLMRSAPFEYAAVVGTYKRNAISTGTHVTAYMSLGVASSVDSFLNALRPSIVIHCAGQGDVDECEKDPRKTRLVNVLHTEHFANRAKVHGCKKFVYLSSNAVFAGDDPPYVESDKRRPVNEYGMQKVEAEDAILTIFGDNALVIRPILLYGWPRSRGRDNWANRIYWWLKAGKKVRVVNDRITQPTYAGDVAQVIWSLIDQAASGIYHVGGLEVCTLFSFARVVADVFGLDKTQISPASSDDFPTLAPRPVNTVYGLEKLYATGIIAPGAVKDGLVMMRDEVIYQTRAQ